MLVAAALDCRAGGDGDGGGRAGQLLSACWLPRAAHFAPSVRHKRGAADDGCVGGILLVGEASRVRTPTRHEGGVERSG